MVACFGFKAPPLRFRFVRYGLDTAKLEDSRVPLISVVANKSKPTVRTTTSPEVRVVVDRLVPIALTLIGFLSAEPSVGTPLKDRPV